MLQDGRAGFRPKAFGIGFHKTGTTSLALALQHLGYRVTGPNEVENPDIAAIYVELACQLSEQFDAFQDNPWPLVYREMDALHPGSRFILTVRSPESWLASVKSHFSTHTTPMRELIYGAGLGSPCGHEDAYVARYERHNAEVLAYFEGRPDDLLVMDITKGDGWEQLAPFLGHPIPANPFPYANAGAVAQGASSPRVTELASVLRRKLARLAKPLVSN